MKIGEVMRKERTARGLNRYASFTVEDLAERLGVSPEAYAQIEAGDAAVEAWFPLLCRLAAELEIPTSFLLATSGKSGDCRPGQIGALIRLRREARGHTAEEMAKIVGSSIKEYVGLEAGKSPCEQIGPLMLRFAELIEQPVFNLYHPCGVPHDQLDDYP